MHPELQNFIDGYESKKDSIAMDERKPIEALFSALSSESCQPLIDYIATNTPDQSLAFQQEFYNNVFETALLMNLTGFISNLLQCDEVLKHLEKPKLLEYLLKTGNFQNRAWSVMAENKELLTERCREAADACFRNHSAMTPFLSAMLETHKRIFLNEWVLAYLSEGKNDPEAREAFLKLIPTDEESLSIVLERLLHYCHRKKIYAALEEFLMQFKPSSKTIAAALLNISPYHFSSINRDVSEYSFKTLLTLIPLVEKTDPHYQGFILIAAFLKEAPENRASFIQNNPSILDPKQSSDEMVMALVYTITDEEQDNLLEHYISNPNASEHLCVFTRHIFKDKSSLLITRFLQASHTKLISEQPFRDLFKSIYGITIRYTPEIIELLLKRKDYNVMNDDLHTGLANLFDDDEVSAAMLLNDARVFEWLIRDAKQLAKDIPYYSLIPKVLGWYIKFSDKAPLLFMSIPEKLRGQMLGKFVPASIDKEEPTLRALIIKLGKQDMIDAMGGIHQRLISSGPLQKPTLYVPNFWQRPKVTESLRTLQKKIATNYIEKHYQNITLTREHSAKNTSNARLAAKHYRGGLLLQHESKVSNIEFALRDSRLKTRLHIQGHQLFGKSSKGLIIAQHELEHPKNFFTFFTRINHLEDNIRPTHGDGTPPSPTQTARIVIDVLKLLAENSHIPFIILGYYQFFETCSLKISDGTALTVDPSRYREGEQMYRIDFNKDEEYAQTIYQKLFELVFSDILRENHPEIVKRLTEPQTESDYQLARDILALLPLEWLIPGDQALKFSYVEKIELGTKEYFLSELRQTVLEASEEEVLKAIAAYEDIEKLPFVLEGILSIALKRKHTEVIQKIYQLTHSYRRELPFAIVSYPKEVYEIESMVQLLLEDCTERVYVHYTDDAIHIKSTLKFSSNRNAVHHAAMAILCYALAIGELQGGNALAMRHLEDQLTIPIGSNARYKSLTAIRDALLTYELSTLLVCAQNLNYYEQHNGEFHPITGRGATNGRVALMKDRLFHESIPYEIQFSEIQTIINGKKTSKLFITTPNEAIAKTVAEAITKHLEISNTLVTVDEECVCLNMKPAELIAALRTHAIFYEGINVLTEDGRLLLADRGGMGLASAGGHHGDKYLSKGMAYSLHSEFALTFKDPKSLTDTVTRLDKVKTISKTGIYIVPYSALSVTEATTRYARENNLPVAFCADKQEFELKSEAALTLAEMRGKAFYDVMPIVEIALYQRDALMQALQEKYQGIGQMIEIQMNSEIEIKFQSSIHCKIPSSQFGRITVKIYATADEDLKAIFAEKSTMLETSEDKSYSIYTTDESPLALLHTLQERMVLSMQPRHVLKY